MKTGVILITLGGPRSLEEIPGFIKNFTGRDIPPPAMKAVIERYKEIGGFSPLVRITGDQANKLNDTLGEAYICLPAFRHVKPFIEDAIDSMVALKTSRILFLLLSPFYTSVTTGNYMEVAKAYTQKLSLTMPVDFIHSWYSEPLFIRCWADRIERASFDEKAFYLFSAHSLPVKYSGEPYRRQIEETVELVSSQAGISNYALGWQSIPNNVSEPWITPLVEEKINEIALRGFRSIVQVPIGFTADHIETLYDIDITHKRYALAKGLAFRRLSSLNADDAFIKALREIITKFVNLRKDEQ